MAIASGRNTGCRQARQAFGAYYYLVFYQRVIMYKMGKTKCLFYRKSDNIILNFHQIVRIFLVNVLS